MRIGSLDERALRLARVFWPGPLTLVVKRRPGARVSKLALAGLDSVAIRLPAHPIARALIQAVARPVVAPSANRSGRLSPTRAGDVVRALGGRLAMVIDGGPCAIGIESTVVDARGPRVRLLRPGGIPAEAIAAIVGELAGATEGPARSPGQMLSHYAPRRPLRMNAPDARAGEAYLGFGPPAPGVTPTLNLSPSGDLGQAAARLYGYLAALDRPPFTAIAVAPIPRTGLGLAINDRLARASAPRGAGRWAVRAFRSRAWRPAGPAS